MSLRHRDRRPELQWLQWRWEEMIKNNYSAMWGCQRCTWNGHLETEWESQLIYLLFISEIFPLCKCIFVFHHILLILRYLHSNSSLKSMICGGHRMKETFSPNKLDKWELAAKEWVKVHEGWAQHGEQNKASRETPGAGGNHRLCSRLFKRFCGRTVIPGEKKEVRHKYWSLRIFHYFCILKLTTVCLPCFH